VENGVEVDAMYTDFSKTSFDKVSHRLLLRKLAKLGFGDSFLDWIGSYLTDREQFVKAISSSQSRRFSVRSGVPHGSHLGPLLLISFINDVFLCFKSLRILSIHITYTGMEPRDRTTSVLSKVPFDLYRCFEF
jgi:hypothetical protein